MSSRQPQDGKAKFEVTEGKNIAVSEIGCYLPQYAHSSLIY